MSTEVCLPEAIDGYVPTYEDIRRKVLTKFVEKVYISRSIRRQGRERVRVMRYLIKCERVFQIVAEELGRIARLPRTSSMHPFYAELITIASDGKYDEVLDKVAKGVKIVSKLWREYRQKILSCYTGAEAKNVAREYVGRTLSVVRRVLRDIDVVRNAVKIIKRTPCIDPNAPTIIIAGMPQVGKSTLVSKISSAKPEIAPYPFTTKHIILGHLKIGPIYIQIIDTPGILDRPVEEMNEIERRAVAALKHLKAVTLFLIDPSRDSYYSIDKQLKVLESIASFIEKERLLVVFNKIDKVDLDRVEKVKKLVENLGLEVHAMISALYGYGVDRMMAIVARKLCQLYNLNIPNYC